jgi:opacity protein-like surface antigen
LPAFSQYQKSRGFAEIYGGANSSRFLNTDFAEKIESKYFEPNIGYIAGLRAVYGVFMLDVFTNSTTLKIQNTAHPENARNRISLTGGSLNLFLFPTIKDYFTAFAGAGYANSSWILEYPDGKTSNNSGSSSGSKSTTKYTKISEESSSALFWNVGLRGKINRVSISATYRQSLEPTLPGQKFSSFDLSIAYIFYFFDK